MPFPVEMDYSDPDFGHTQRTLDILRLIQGIPHRERRRALNKLRTTPRKPHLYKYIAIGRDRALSRKKLSDLLANGRLYLATPQEFNDPFEFRADFSFTPHPVALRRHFTRTARLAAKDMGDQTIGKNRRTEQLVARAMKKALDPEQAYESFNRSRNSQGISCFTTSARNLLMWSHYGNGHSGICIQFDPLRCPGVLLMTHQVNYRASPPKIIWPDDRDKIFDVIVGKSSEWSYEDEWRFISTKIFSASIDFNPHAVTGIILGARFGESSNGDDTLLKSVLQMRKNLGLPALKIYRCHTQRHTFRMKILRESGW